MSVAYEEVRQADLEDDTARSDGLIVTVWHKLRTAFKDSKTDAEQKRYNDNKKGDHAAEIQLEDLAKLDSIDLGFAPAENQPESSTGGCEFHGPSGGSEFYDCEAEDESALTVTPRGECGSLMVTEDDALEEILAQISQLQAKVVAIAESRRRANKVDMTLQLQAAPSDGSATTSERAPS